MNDYEIRLLGSHDIDVFDHVADDVFDHDLVPATIGEFLHDPRHHVAVALADGMIVGFVSAVHYVHPDKVAPELWINEVGVAEGYRRHGLARQMINLMLDHGRRLGCHEAWVLTERDNHAAMNLYVAIGGAEDHNDTVMFNFRL